MSPDIPAVPPEAEVIRLARKAMDMTADRAAEASRSHDGRGVSAAYWRDVERGYGGRRGQRVKVRASDRALAAMARVVGVRPAQLTAAGREDAARVLEEALRREGRVFPPPPGDGPAPERSGLFGDLPPELAAQVEPHLRVIEGRAEAAAAAHPGVPLQGRWVFPADPGEAARWDGIAAKGFAVYPGRGFTRHEIALALAIAWWTLARQEQGRSASGLAAPPARA